MNEEQDPLLAGIEAGGTKYVCAVGRQPDDPLREVRFPTTSPAETLEQAAAFFRKAVSELGPIHAMGIGTFGPADVNPRSPGYGGILTTPKSGWTGFNLVNALREGIGEPVPVAIDTDVNAAAIGEAEFGAGRNQRNVAYVTIGTGIGGGILLDGQPLHGRMHPEIGHLVMPDIDDPGHATSACPFHDRCLEGRASGPAIEKRWGQPATELPPDHPAWELEARYLAAGALDLTAAWSPDVIILGGGVMQQSHLIDMIRGEFHELAGDYWTLPPLDTYLVTPQLGQNAGVVGALAMARRLL
jgi:fructokinase